MALLFPDRTSLERSRVGGAGERYEYTPYGTRTIRVDLTPPAVEQLREAGGKLLLEFSEEILLQRVRDAITSGQLTLRDTTDDAPIAITADQPVRDGKQKGRRLLLTPVPVHPPAANHGMLLHIEPGAMVDLFENRPEMAYEKAFVWLGAEQAIDDTAPPRVDLVLTKAGELEVGFSEEIDPAVASAAILLDGAPRTWTAMPDGYTLKPASAISATTHSLQIGPALIDKVGLSLAEPFARSITTGGTDQIAYERPDPRITPTSTLDNLASFQGHITDPATGLVYMRNRWMDPEMGRFLSADPLRGPESPSPTAALGNNALGNHDSLGLYEEDVHQFLTTFLARSAGFSQEVADRLGNENQDLDRDARSAMHNGVSQRNMILFHFVSEQRLLALHGGATAPSKLNDQAARSIGEYLHALEDTYSHQMHPTRRVFGMYYKGLQTEDSAHIGHGLEGHDPDWTWKRWELAMDMSREVFTDLALLCLKYQENCSPTEYSSVVQSVFEFVVFKPEIIPESLHLPKLMTVENYGPKIDLLNSSFSGYNTPEKARRLKRSIQFRGFDISVLGGGRRLR